MKHELPRDIRFVHSRRGELNYEGIRFPCLIQEISVSGLSIICARDTAVGQELHVMFDLTPGHFYQCKIRVKRVDNDCFGAAITHAEANDSKAFQEFVNKRFKELKSPRLMR